MCGANSHLTNTMEWYVWRGDAGYTRLTALCLGLPRWASTRKVKPIWISLKQETVSGSGISWAICKSAPRSRQITTPAPHRSVFYRPGALPAAQPTASKHWRHSPGTRHNEYCSRSNAMCECYHWNTSSYCLSSSSARRMCERPSSVFTCIGALGTPQPNGTPH